MKKTLITTLLLSFALISCGSRKVQKSEVKEEVKETVTETKQNDVKIETNIKVIDSVNEITFEPIDNSKPIIVNGKSYTNVKIKHTKKRTETTSKAVLTDKGITTKQTKKEAVKQSKNKEVELKESLTSYWWLILLIGGIYYLWNKYLRNLN